jgi:hypothetical protein
VAPAVDGRRARRCQPRLRVASIGPRLHQLDSFVSPRNATIEVTVQCAFRLDPCVAAVTRQVVARPDIAVPSICPGLEAHGRRFHFGPDAEHSMTNDW